MSFTHLQARALVERHGLIGPSHGTVAGDFERVQRAFAECPQLGAVLNALDPERMEETPQGAAAHLGCQEILRFFLTQGVKLDPFMAGALGMIDPLAHWLRAHPHLANARGAHGIPLLNHAFHRPILQLLLDHGADPNVVVYAPWGWTPLHEAAARGRADTVAALVDAGAKLNPGPDRVTALHAAARAGHQHVITWLLDRGADPDAIGHGEPWHGKTALTLALEYGHEEIAELLRRFRPPVRQSR